MAKFKEEKRLVYQHDAIDLKNVNGRTLGELIAELENLQAKHGDSAVVDLDFGYDYEDEYRYSKLRIQSQRLETDEEYEARKAQHKATQAAIRADAKQRKLQREANERAEYERLSKKYGTNERAEYERLSKKYGTK